MKRLFTLLFPGLLGAAIAYPIPATHRAKRLLNTADTVAEIAKASINGVHYTAMYTTGYNVYIKGPGGKILFRQNAAGFVGFEFADFNGDGYKDLQISYISNTPGIADLLLYDKRSKNLRLVKAFDNYPDAIRIKHTNMYYSYHHSGCADADWDSDLFKIENFKTVRIGNINCQDCSNNPKENRISVYTVNNKDRKLLKTFKSDIVNDYTDTKWGFIAWYWKRNHKHFTK